MIQGFAFPAGDLINAMHTQYYQEGLERLGGTAVDYGETLQRLNNLSVMQPYNQKIGVCAKIISTGTLQTYAKSSSSTSLSSQKNRPSSGQRAFSDGFLNFSIGYDGHCPPAK